MHREHHDENEKGGLRRSYWIGLILAPILALLAYVFLPSESLNESGDVVAGLSHNGRAVVAVAVLMATLWVTEALPLAVTALLPIVMFPLFTGGVIPIRSVTTAYGHDLIYLYLGGFMIAMAMQRWGLHRRIALHTVLFFGTQPARLVAGFMVATAFLSMWVSNTATTVMMMPIAMSVVELVRRELIKSGDSNFNPDHKHFNFAICLMLGIAYAAAGRQASLGHNYFVGRRACSCLCDQNDWRGGIHRLYRQRFKGASSGGLDYYGLYHGDFCY